MTVCVITPSFNQGRFIQRTIDSVIGQDVPDLEYVVFDGGSTDETIDVLRRYDPCLTWVSEKDRGQSHAVNKGLQATRAPVIGWLNSDDIYYPGAIKKVLDFFDGNPDVDVIYGMAEHIDIDDRAFEPYPTEPWDPDRLRDTCFICQPSVFFRRSVVERWGMLDERLNYCMDYEYWLRLAAGGAKFHYMQEKLSGSRLYAENKTLGSRVKVHAEINDMQRRLLGRVQDAWLYNYAHAVVDARIDRSKHPRRFVIELGLRSWLAAIRWNHSVSPDMRRLTGNWLLGR
jgi:glycosyltransferase involved in cell wall biosynthesis